MISALDVTRLEKAAHDNGFDLLQSTSGDWLCIASSHCPLKIWLSTAENGVILIGFADRSVARSLLNLGIPLDHNQPSGASDLLSVPDLTSLYALLKRAFQLSRALPSAPLNEFRQQIQTLPNATEAERVVIQRVGQNIFRERLIEYWDGGCAVTGLRVPALLRASHIKPWRDCASDAERLDVFNGLLLAPNLDLAFDQGFISFEDVGTICLSRLLDETAVDRLGFSPIMRISGLALDHVPFLKWHREHIFQRQEGT